MTNQQLIRLVFLAVVEDVPREALDGIWASESDIFEAYEYLSERGLITPDHKRLTEAGRLASKICARI